MSYYPTPKSLPSAHAEASLIAAILTLAVLLGIPLTQKLSDTFDPIENPVIEPTIIDPPTIVERDPPPPPPKDKVKIDQIKREVPKLTIDQIAISMNPNVTSIYRVSTAGLIPETGISDLFDPADLTRQPEPIQRAQPHYPREMKAAKIDGVVHLEFVVTLDGRTRDVRVLRSSNPAFEEPARRAVRRWLFKPGERDGKPVNSRVRLQMPFRVH